MKGINPREDARKYGKGILFGITAIATLGLAENAYAFFDPTGPAQLMYLSKILLEDYKRFRQLQSMIEQGRAQSDYLRWVHAGIDQIGGIIATLPVQDNEVLADLRDFQKALSAVDRIYGAVPKGPEQAMQLLHDRTIAESFRLTNGVKDYAASQEQNASRAFQMSNSMSPKGAERLAAATNAQILHTLTQLLRVNGELLKLQSEQFAFHNKQDKESVEHFNQSGRDIKARLTGFSGDLQLPRFQ